MQKLARLHLRAQCPGSVIYACFTRKQECTARRNPGKVLMQACFFSLRKFNTQMTVLSTIRSSEKRIAEINLGFHLHDHICSSAVTYF